MRVSERGVFVHIPRSAGQFVWRLLDDLGGWGHVGSRRDHSPLRELPLSQRGLPVFAVARDPPDWHVSYWAFARLEVNWDPSCPVRPLVFPYRERTSFELYWRCAKQVMPEGHLSTVIRDLCCFEDGRLGVTHWVNFYQLAYGLSSVLTVLGQGISSRKIAARAPVNVSVHYPVELYWPHDRLVELLEVEGWWYEKIAPLMG